MFNLKNLFSEALTPSEHWHCLQSLRKLDALSSNLSLIFNERKLPLNVTAKMHILGFVNNGESHYNKLLSQRSSGMLFPVCRFVSHSKEKYLYNSFFYNASLTLLLGVSMLQYV